MCFEQDATLGGDLPPLLQKSSVLRAASALGIAGEKAKSIAFTPYKAWVPQATTVLIYVCGNIYIFEYNWMGDHLDIYYINNNIWHLHSLSIDESQSNV